MLFISTRSYSTFIEEICCFNFSIISSSNAVFARLPFHFAISASVILEPSFFPLPFYWSFAILSKRSLYYFSASEVFYLSASWFCKSSSNSIIASLSAELLCATCALFLSLGSPLPILKRSLISRVFLETFSFNASISFLIDWLLWASLSAILSYSFSSASNRFFTPANSSSLCALLSLKVFLVTNLSFISLRRSSPS